MYDKLSPFIQGALSPDLSIVAFNNLLHIAQSQPKTLDIMNPSCRNTEEFIVNMFQVLLTNANSFVLD